MTEKEVLKLFDEYGVILKGHFKLSSGLHSEKYLQCAIILQYPEVTERLAKALAKKFPKAKIGEFRKRSEAKFPKIKIDLVIGPALGGMTLAYEVARALGVRGIFAERQDGKMKLRRGFSIKDGEKALVVEDVVTTGDSTKEVIELVRGYGASVIGVGTIIDRSENPPDFGVEFKALAKIRIETFEEDECPLCKENIPITKPGSRQ